jgi:hypothetical protein
MIDGNKPTCGPVGFRRSYSFLRILTPPQGEHQGCLCDPPTQTYINPYSANEQQSMNVIFDLLGNIKTPPGSGSTKQHTLNIVLQMSSDYNNGISLYEFSYLFFVTDTGSDSLCALFPTAVYNTWLSDWRTVGPPSGTFSVNVPKQPGFEYMNDGRGNAGALWCGAKATSCHYNRLEGTYWTNKSCVNLGSPGHPVNHQAIVYCEISRLLG